MYYEQLLLFKKVCQNYVKFNWTQILFFIILNQHKKLQKFRLTDPWENKPKSYF